MAKHINSKESKQKSKKKKKSKKSNKSIPCYLSEGTFFFFLFSHQMIFLFLFSSFRVEIFTNAVVQPTVVRPSSLGPIYLRDAVNIAAHRLFRFNGEMKSIHQDFIKKKN